MLAAVRRTLRSAVRRAGGTEVDARADEYFAVFTTAAAALDSALAVQRSMAAATWPDGRRVGLRIGLHTGRPTRATGAYVGIAVSTGARICALAEGGQVLLSRSVRTALGEDAAAALRPLGPHRLRGISDAIELFEAHPQP
jgi:adenylate cyclase